jgi:hypothetical protein
VRGAALLLLVACGPAEDAGAVAPVEPGVRASDAAAPVEPGVRASDAAAPDEPGARASDAAAPVEPPDEPGALRAWLQGGGYLAWSAAGPVRATGEHGGARVFFNAALAGSLAAGAREHPRGAAAVREIYEADLTTLRGLALMKKVSEGTGPKGQAAGWYWYEVYGRDPAARPAVAEVGARGCVGCHAAGVDFVHPAG